MAEASSGILFDHCALVGWGRARVYSHRACALAGSRLADDAAATGHGADDGGANGALQIENRVIVAGF